MAGRWGVGCVCHFLFLQKLPESLTAHLCLLSSPFYSPPKAWSLSQRNLVRIHGLQTSKTIVVSLLTFFF